jgi:hypothetical protein
MNLPKTVSMNVSLGLVLAWLFAVLFFCLPASAKYSGGTGEPNDPYRIASAEDLNDIGNYEEDWDKHFVLVNDVNLAEYTGTQFKIIGNSIIKFTGVFDGNGYKIWNFTWASDARNGIGLFAYVGAGGLIKNLGMERIDVNATNRYYVGGLVGANYGTIIDCYATGSVSGYEFIGGLVGYNVGMITSCYSSIGVSGNLYVGGLVGKNEKGVITNCYSTGSVSGMYTVGGLVGGNAGTIVHCFSISRTSGSGAVGGLVGYGGGAVNSFWDIQTSNQTTSAGGTGKTTAEIKTSTTYFGWRGCDVNEIWTLDEGNEYPHLAWEGKPGQPLPKQQLSDFLGGSGTDSDPYLISTSQQLNLIGLFPCEWNKRFTLVADIDLAALPEASFNIIGVAPSASFGGVFDGNDHKIRNFTWTSDCISYVGLFGCVGEGGQIKNLRMENVNVKATNGYYVSGMVGQNYNGTIINCYSSGSVSGRDYICGLVGANDGGMITNCHSSVSVSGQYYVGGLVGVNSGSIIDSYFIDSVSGILYVGGLVGSNSGTMTNCYSTGTVSCGSEKAGGLAGNNSGTITNCYSSGSVSGYELIGGLVGYNPGAISSSYSNSVVSGIEWYIGGLVGSNWGGTITNCYSSASVSGQRQVGGLVGQNFNGTITNCYSSSKVLGSGKYIGGLVGYGGGVIISFWDIQTSGQSISAGGTGKTTDEMKTATTFAVWGACGNEGIWTIDDGNDYPRLEWENKPGQPLPQYQLSDFLEGSGTDSDPYMISTTQQLNLIGQFPCEWDKHYILVDDINLADYTGTRFNIIGVTPGASFRGVFDGNGHKTWSFTCASDCINYIGVFGCISSGGQIKNLGMENVDVRATNVDYVSGLVAYNYGTITNCYSTGLISGIKRVGGLAGHNGGTISSCYSATSVSGSYDVAGIVGTNSGTITICNFSGNVSGGSDVGGLVGGNGGTISSCYSEAIVSGNYDIGGLVGVNGGTIINCYATASVSSVANCVGGIVGENGGTITACYSSGAVLGDQEVGGLVGMNYEGTITNCCSSADVSGTDCVGGLVGQNGGYNLIPEGPPFVPGWVYNSYSTGNVSGDAEVGGLVGEHIYGEIGASFWDIETSDCNTSAGGIPKTTGEMKTQSTFTSAGWDFTNETANGTNDYWRMCVDDVEYPLLSWQFVPDFVCPDGVDILDLAFFVERWLAEYYTRADINYDRQVNFLDFAVFASHWLEER